MFCCLLFLASACGCWLAQQWRGAFASSHCAQLDGVSARCTQAAASLTDQGSSAPKPSCPSAEPPPPLHLLLSHVQRAARWRVWSSRELQSHLAPRLTFFCLCHFCCVCSQRHAGGRGHPAGEPRLCGDARVIGKCSRTQPWSGRSCAGTNTRGTSGSNKRRWPQHEQGGTPTMHKQRRQQCRCGPAASLACGIAHLRRAPLYN